MIIINRLLCSPEFNTALDALNAGESARRASWPEGMYLQKHATGSIAVFRSGQLASPTWHGPSNDETEANDWTVV